MHLRFLILYYLCFWLLLVIFSCLLQNGENGSTVEKRLEIPEELTAPIEKGQEIGKLLYYYGDRKLGEIAVVAEQSVEAAKYMDYVKRVWLAWMM